MIKKFLVILLIIVFSLVTVFLTYRSLMIQNVRNEVEALEERYIEYDFSRFNEDGFNKVFFVDVYRDEIYKDSRYLEINDTSNPEKILEFKKKYFNHNFDGQEKDMVEQFLIDGEILLKKHTDYKNPMMFIRYDLLSKKWSVTLDDKIEEKTLQSLLDKIEEHQNLTDIEIYEKYLSKNNNAIIDLIHINNEEIQLSKHGEGNLYLRVHFYKDTLVGILDDNSLVDIKNFQFNTLKKNDVLKYFNENGYSETDYYVQLLKENDAYVYMCFSKNRLVNYTISSENKNTTDLKTRYNQYIKNELTINDVIENERQLGYTVLYEGK